jgi:hypothetical protein
MTRAISISHPALNQANPQDLQSVSVIPSMETEVNLVQQYHRLK